MVWLTVTEYLCHNSVWCDHNPILSLFMTYYRVATSGLTISKHQISSPVFRGVRVVPSFVLCVVFSRPLIVCVVFHLAIILSILRFTDSDHHFGIFNVFRKQHRYLGKKYVTA